MLEVKNLSIKVGTFSLDNISLSLEHSKSHLILGPSGCGKTLLMESIVGLKKIKQGRVLLDDRDVDKLPTEKREIAYVPQDLAIFPHLNVEENIYYGIKAKHKIIDDNVHKRVEELTDILNIKQILKRPVTNLSGGELQRVAIARALAPTCRLLVLDEPFSSLPQSMKRELWFSLKSLQQKYNLTLLMVTHDFEEAFFLGDTVTLLIDGKIHQTGEKTSIYSWPLSIKAAKFLGVSNLFHAKINGIKDDTISALCDVLNTSFDIPKKNVSLKVEDGTKAILGIRSEDIIILRPKYQKKNQENVLKGSIQNIFTKHNTHIILFLPQNSNKTIEIEVPNYAYAKLNLEIGKDVSITLKKESCFLLPEDESYN